MINLIELNIILYYADFLSLKETSTHVTDNCKYYYIYNSPINLAYIVDSLPFYNPENKYYLQAYDEYNMLKNKADNNIISDFVSNICNLASMGVVDARLMLKQIHQFSTKTERNQAFRDYEKWINTQYYTHIITDDKGDRKREYCTRYIAHAERNTASDPRVYYNEKISK